ncbi:hypothetical protein BDQ17DRAFT_1344473 [Cyathus striatus]|nr:hypothetical protein BDQ17DRAFT_1344473 [Cyathus striatus]
MQVHCFAHQNTMKFFFTPALLTVSLLAVAQAQFSISTCPDTCATEQPKCNLRFQVLSGEPGCWKCCTGRAPIPILPTTSTDTSTPVQT